MVQYIETPPECRKRACMNIHQTRLIKEFAKKKKSLIKEEEPDKNISCMCTLPQFTSPFGHLSSHIHSRVRLEFRVSSINSSSCLDFGPPYPTVDIALPKTKGSSSLKSFLLIFQKPKLVSSNNYT